MVSSLLPWKMFCLFSKYNSIFLEDKLWTGKKKKEVSIATDKNGKQDLQ